MNIYVAKRDGTKEVFNGITTEELENVGFDADTELVYLDTYEREDEAAAECNMKAIPEFIGAQEENEWPESKLSGETNPVLQGVVEKFGGDPSDWHCTYAESGGQFFDGGKLIDQNGVSIEDLIPEDRLTQYQELIETWKDNSHEVQHLEWWEKTDQGETLHVTALRLGENDEVMSETWSHTIESEREGDQSDEEIVAASEDDLEFVTETFADTMPERPDLLRAEDFDSDPQILDLTAYLEKSLSTQEILDDADSLLEASPFVPGPEVDLVKEKPVITETGESGLTTLTVPLDAQREFATEERPAETITPAIEISNEGVETDIIEPHEIILESETYVPEIAEPILVPEVTMPIRPPAAELNNLDAVVFDDGLEPHPESANEGVGILDATLGTSTEERGGSEQAPLEVLPPKATEQSIVNKHILTAPEVTDAKDSMQEITLQADGVGPEEISLPREIVLEPTALEHPLERVRNASVSIEKLAEIAAVAVEFVPEISVPDTTINTQKLDSKVQVKKTEAQKEESIKDAVETSPQLVNKARETKLQDSEVADTYLTDTAPDTYEDEPKLMSSYDDANEKSAILEKIVDKSENKKTKSALPIVLSRREILLRSFGLTSEQIRRYHGRQQGSLRLAGIAGVNNAPAKASGIILAGDRHNGISLLRYAA